MSANPKSKSALSTEKRLNRKVQGSSTSSRAHEQDYNEKIRRDDDPLDAAPAPTPPLLIARPTPTTATPVNPPPAAIIQRWHKKSDWYITVTPTNKVDPDPDPDPSAFHTITDAINYAKITIYPALSLIYMNPIIEIEVHGGFYDEQITIDVPYLHFQGIGMPFLTWSGASNPTDSVITVTGDCTSLRFDGFFVNNPTLFDASIYALIVEEGPEAGEDKSELQFTNCRFYGNGTELYIQRWSYFHTCEIYSVDNYDTGYGPALMVRYCVSHPQSKWTRFVNCTISGQDDKGDPLKKGQALGIFALESDLTTWVPNSLTIGGIVDPNNANFYCKSGVIFQWSEIIGWAENYGWALEYQDCDIIQGKYISALIGGVHLTAYCQTTGLAGQPASNINSYTWFNGGLAKVTYLVQYTDTNAGVNVAFDDVWVMHFKHSHPFLAAGGSAMLAFGGGAPNGNLYTLMSSTSMQFWLNAGPPTIDRGSFSNVPHVINREGYLSV